MFWLINPHTSWMLSIIFAVTADNPVLYSLFNFITNNGISCCFFQTLALSLYQPPHEHPDDNSLLTYSYLYICKTLWLRSNYFGQCYFAYFLTMQTLNRSNLIIYRHVLAFFKAIIFKIMVLKLYHSEH